MVEVDAKSVEGRARPTKYAPATIWNFQYAKSIGVDRTAIQRAPVACVGPEQCSCSERSERAERSETVWP